jgi:2-keto-4-pentenoate hydratase
MTARDASAAELLWDTWQRGEIIAELPAELRPADTAEGYAIQARLDALAAPRTGWKIAATGVGGRKALGVDRPLAGPLYERFAVEPGGTIEFASFRMATIEAEFGFVMRGDLRASEAPFERDAVLAALGAFVPAIELPNTRYTAHRTVGGPQLVADASCAGVFVLGQRVEDYDREALRAHRVTFSTDATGAIEGTGEKVLGDPIEAVRWLANELAAHGRALMSGDAVITGAAVPVRDPGPGLAVADFGALGTVAVRLA